MIENQAFEVDQIPSEQRLTLFHNGVPIVDYPERSWFLVPFPLAKGEPFNNDNLATVNQASFSHESRFEAARAAAYSRWGGGGPEH